MTGIYRGICLLKGVLCVLAIIVIVWAPVGAGLISSPVAVATRPSGSVQQVAAEVYGSSSTL